MKPEEIKYHAPKADVAIEKLGLKSTSSAAEVSTKLYMQCMHKLHVLRVSAKAALKNQHYH